MSTASKIGLLMLIALVLSGCLNNARFSSLEPRNDTATNPAEPPVSKTPRSVANPSFYLVKPGDTLYSIAFRFGLDYKKLAKANEIDASYQIFEGQSIALKETTVAPVITKKTENKSSKRQVSPRLPMVTKRTGQKVDSQNAVKEVPSKSSLSWVWPHNGKIVRTFSSNGSTQKGIDLEGRIGDSVLAATDGVVVYAGNGLPGYGNLIIVEHANSLLSAYAFAQNIVVSEKDRVRAGQKIATMGKQSDQPSLHFEIRLNGKPVNPLGYLPKR